MILENKKKLTSYERVMIARDINRPNIREYIESLFENFIEMHGDRLYRDDPSLVGGIATFHDIPVTIIGHQKGHSTEENIACNFGMASPEGYRKANRLMKEAEKFKRPVITIIDTPGAYPGMEAESNGQSNAIAENLALMSRLKVPIIAIVTGEGSSGGALALALADKVWMLENAVYSILSPEGFASIMWKDPSKVKEASDIMKITADDLKNLGLIDDIIPEGKRCMVVLDQMLMHTLTSLKKYSAEQLVTNRYEKFRGIDGLINV